MVLNLLQTKILALICQVIVLTVFAFLPIGLESYVTKKGKRGRIFLSCCRCFGGGALLGSFYLHMVPEVRHLLEKSIMKPNHIKYPLPELIEGGGFFLFLFVEWYIMWKDKKHQKKTSRDLQTRCQTIRSNSVMLTVFTLEKEITKIEHEMSSSGSLDSLPALRAQNSQANLVLDEISVSTPEESGEQHDIKKDIKNTPVGTGARSLILLIALSADGLFQGLAIGLKWSNIAVWNLLVAVVGHEFVVAFCLGLELVRTQPVKRVVISAVAYGLTPAVGTAIGIVLFEVSGNNPDDTKVCLINGILQAVATGVFLYVAFIGILCEELSGHPRLASLLSIFVGFIIMAGLAFYIPKADHAINIEGGTSTVGPDA